MSHSRYGLDENFKYLSMAIIYRYSEEEQQTVPNGKNYRIQPSVINTTQWQATGKATFNLVEPDHPERTVGWVGKPPLSSQNGSIVEGNTTITGGFVIGKVWRIQSGEEERTLYKTQLIYQEDWWLDPSYVPGNEIRGFYPPSLTHWRYPNAGYGYDTSTQEYYYTDVVITYWHPANGDLVYTLKIFDGDTEIFSRTENERPIQVFFRQVTCPPNTCPVNCGTHICCYGSDGIATYSYLK